jgi:HPt (histidine-containing phosphotransfer) domain-containing protein
MSELPFDYDEMLTRCVGKAELVERAMTRFTGDLAADLEMLAFACRASDPYQIASTAHRIKGASANVSAHKLSAAAADLETSARNNEPDEFPQRWEQVKAEANTLTEFLTTRTLA